MPIRFYCSSLIPSLTYVLYEQKLVYQVGSLPTKVVCLTQVVNADELKDDEEYEDIMEDMRLEAGKYGICQHLITTCLLLAFVIYSPGHLLIFCLSCIVPETWHFRLLYSFINSC